MPNDATDNESISELQSSRHRHLIEHIQDAVVEFEFDGDTPIITDVNNSFVEIFGYERTAVIGEPLNEWIVPGWQTKEAQDFDQLVLSGEVTYQRVKRKTASGLREFLYRGIPYQTEIDVRGGFAVYTDLTELNWNEQRFHVMNRILRHNLRNKTNIIDGHLSILFQQLNNTELEITETKKTLESAVGNLERLIEEAHAIRTIIGESGTEGNTVDCVPLIEEAVKIDRQSCPSANIEMELPESLPVRATSNLQFAIESLIDNAIKHNPSASPYVLIRAEYADSDDWVNLYVEDDGPMIPSIEKEVVTGTAEISSTNHGAGLGLWLVKWTTEKFGGELLFEESEFGGNSVHIRLVTN